MDQITTSVRQQHWLEIIKACNESSLSNKEWCAQNGVNINSFYYWQRLLRWSVHDAHAASVSAVSETKFAEISLPVSAPMDRPETVQTDFHPDAVIRSSTLTIEVSNQVSPDVLAFLRAVMKDAS